MSADNMFENPRSWGIGKPRREEAIFVFICRSASCNEDKSEEFFVCSVVAADCNFVVARQSRLSCLVQLFFSEEVPKEVDGMEELGYNALMNLIKATE